MQAKLEFIDVIKNIDEAIKYYELVKKVHVAKFTESIEDHAYWIFTDLYSKPYPNGKKRLHHGMEHICRAAMYVPVWAHLLRWKGHEGALLLTNDDIKLLQIVMLLHDAAREDDGEDKWDKQSAIILYLYLKKLNIPEEKLRKLTIAMANKDSELDDDPLTRIYQIIIHDSDCLDIIRARDHFDGKKLFFYQLYKDDVIDYIAQMRVEAQSIIRKHGDLRGALQNHIKEKFAHSYGFSKSEQTIEDDSYLLMSKLYNKGILLSEEELKEKITLPAINYDANLDWFADHNLNVLMRKGKLFARGMINSPSSIHPKDQTIESGKIERTLASIDRYCLIL